MIKIICEAGCNWRTLDEAFQFIDESKRLGLFATKFQLFEEKQIQEADPNIQDFLRTIQLTFNDARDLWNYGQDIGQEVFFTPMFLEAVDWCELINVNYYKIRHKDRKNEKLYKKIWRTKKEHFISISLNENFYSLGGISHSLYCIPEYPAWWMDYLNFKLGDFFCRHFEGISDHSEGILLLKDFNLYFTDKFYFEKHMRLDTYQDCLEKDWSVTFSQLEEVLNK